MCVDQPGWDLNFNGIKAQIGSVRVPDPDLPGRHSAQDRPHGTGGHAPTEPIFVLIPMFSVDNDQNPNDAISCSGVVPGTNCGPALGSALISLFGFLPEGFKAKPLVYTQCPDPNSPPGTCTMHASRIDLGLALEQLGLVPPPAANLFVPTPNHSHVVLNTDLNTRAIWWEVVQVLVINATNWPPQDGTSGITSKAKLAAAEQAGAAIQVPSNFFLFFGTQPMSAMHNH
jgi:hypothetical protein